MGRGDMGRGDVVRGRAEVVKVGEDTGVGKRRYGEEKMWQNVTVGLKNQLVDKQKIWHHVNIFIIAFLLKNATYFIKQFAT